MRMTRGRIPRAKMMSDCWPCRRASERDRRDVFIVKSTMYVRVSMYSFDDLHRTAPATTSWCELQRPEVFLLPGPASTGGDLPLQKSAPEGGDVQGGPGKFGDGSTSSTQHLISISSSGRGPRSLECKVIQLFVLFLPPP
jgi:hypothetical protein